MRSAAKKVGKGSDPSIVWYAAAERHRQPNSELARPHVAV